MALASLKYPDLNAAADALEQQPYKNVMNDVNDDQLQQSLLQRSFGGGGGQSWLKEPARNFFTDPSNLIWAKKVMLFYDRGIPSYNDSNWWDDQFKFFMAAKYMKTVNFNINPTVNDCKSIDSQYTAVQKLIESVQQDNVTGNVTGTAFNLEMQILQDMGNFLSGKFGGLNCQAFLTSQEQQNQLAAVSAAADLSTSTGNKTNYTLYAIYGIAAIIFIAGLMIFLKKK